MIGFSYLYQKKLFTIFGMAHNDTFVQIGPKTIFKRFLRDSQSRGPVLKTTGWLLGWLSLSSFWGQ